jgi:predicted PhzF superfamily epimerase YddE/YHI9
MRLPIHQIDAFATRAFAGNPAAVMLLDGRLPESILQAIAAENIWTVRAFLPHMLAAGEGHIATVASAAGLAGTSRLVDYSA